MIARLLALIVAFGITGTAYAQSTPEPPAPEPVLEFCLGFPRHKAEASSLDRRGAPLRGLSQTECREGVLADDGRQRFLRAGESRARSGHRGDHAEDVVGQHAAGLGLGPGRFHGQSARPPIPGEQLLQHRARQRPQFLGIGRPHRVRQRHVGILRRDQPRVAERSRQHNPRRDRARRDVPPHGLAGARYAQNRRRPARSEIAATALDPITGVNRFITGDSSRVSDKPAEFVPTQLRGHTALGALWRGTNTRAVASNGEPFLEVDLLYGDPTVGRTRTPYDAFDVSLRFGGGAKFSEARVRGRLIGQPFKQGRFQLNVATGLRLRAERRLSVRRAVFRASRIVPPSSCRNARPCMSWAGAA